MRWDDPSKVEEAVWYMRLADLPRGENRTILNQLYNGDPPFDEAKAEENNIEINRNDLEGVNLLAQARRQWNTAFLNTENYFTVSLDSGPVRKRAEWSRTITRQATRVLKKQRRQLEEKRATGANVMLHGPGLCTWNNRRSVIASPLAVSSVLIPSETDIDFENLSYFALFREWTPAQLYEMTHGPRVDPGWNMDLVKSQLKYVGEQTQKQPNATAYQYMPERIEELVKQDLGFWGSDAVPTVDVWDFFFREDVDGKGWYRRTILDWGITEGSYADKSRKPDHSNKDANGKFLYDSKNRKYANSLSEILHCNAMDCSAVAPFKYHSIRSLGWMLWGVCDLQNRLHCKFNEAVFEQLMWFFRTASNNDLVRLKKANFMHMGVIPAGIDWVKAGDRFTPDMGLVNLAFTRNRSLMNDSAASFSQQFDKGAGEKEMTATETMARVNQVNALVSGMLSLSYCYEDFKYAEQCRRLCIKIKPDPIAAEFRRGCLREGVPEEMLDAERWRVQSERILGAGNKTLALAQAQFLQQIRPNLGPDAQRRVDHIAIDINTDDPALAEELAPVQGEKKISQSMHDAQLMTERLMRGLPVVQNPDMVFEDYVLVWLADLEFMTGQAAQVGMAKPEDLVGWSNMVKEINTMIESMGQNPADKEKLREYQQRLGKVVNLITGFTQRLKQQMSKQNGAGAPGQAAPDPKDLAKITAEELKAQQKVKQMAQSHGARTAQKQVQFEMDQARKDRESAAEIRREDAKAASELSRNRMEPIGPFAE